MSFADPDGSTFVGVADPDGNTWPAQELEVRGEEAAHPGRGAGAVRRPDRDRTATGPAANVCG
jgi:hypothetical protein